MKDLKYPFMGWTPQLKSSMYVVYELNDTCTFIYTFFDTITKNTQYKQQK